MRNEVPGCGPRTGPMLFIGEAPGDTEERKGYPFAGRTGQHVRRILGRAGLSPDLVRFNNVIPINPGKLPTNQAALKAVVHKWWDNLAEDLACHKAKVIVACGRAALYRLTGLTGIRSEHGGTWDAGSIGQHQYWGSRLYSRGLIRGTHDAGVEGGDTESGAPVSDSVLSSCDTGHSSNAGVPRRRLVDAAAPVRDERCVVVATIHPAAAMRSKIGADWLRIERAIERAARYATGELTYQPLEYELIRYPDPGTLDSVLAASDEVAIDAEFDAKTNTPFLFGLTVDGFTVYSFPPTNKYVKVLRRHMARRDLMKIAHYHVADTTALAMAGVDTCAPWFDTLEAFSHLYPDLPVGLAPASLYYFDHLSNWKWMPHDDPGYNAIDVIVAYRLKQMEQEELVAAGLWDSFWEERMPVAPLMALMEDRGLQVDDPERQRAIRESETREEHLLAAVTAAATSIYDKRIANEKTKLAAIEQEVLVLTEKAIANVVACPKHPDYTGLRGKKFAADPECTCRETHAAQEDFRSALATVRKPCTGIQNRLKRWSGIGFDPGNSDHVRWLLYDKDALCLPKQYKDKRLTANADAVAKLLSMEKVRAKGCTQLLMDIKDVQHERKKRSTFLFGATKKHEDGWALDGGGVAHPPMRAFGAGTGRPAGGADDATGDRRASPYSFNALNIPEDCRNIYIPHHSLAINTGAGLARKYEEEEEDEHS